MPRTQSCATTLSSAQFVSEQYADTPACLILSMYEWVAVKLGCSLCNHGAEGILGIFRVHCVGCRVGIECYKLHQVVRCGQQCNYGGL
jgi:hypothetical protein